jgi:hypothetical protein
MKKLVSTTVALVGALWLCTASAGTKLSYPLLISSTSASGALGTIRNDSSTQNFLNCTLWACPYRDCGAAVGTFAMECMASSATANVDCTSTNPNLIAAVQAMSPDSYVSFVADRAGPGAICTAVTVANGSIFELPSLAP